MERDEGESPVGGGDRRLEWAETDNIDYCGGPALGTSSGTELEPEGGCKGVRPGLVGQGLGFETQDLRVDRTKVVS